MTKVRVDQDTCIGCGACCAVSEELFELDDEGKSKERKCGELGEKDGADAKEAEQICPVQAIKVEEQKKEEDCLVQEIKAGE